MGFFKAPPLKNYGYWQSGKTGFGSASVPKINGLYTPDVRSQGWTNIVEMGKHLPLLA